MCAVIGVYARNSPEVLYYIRRLFEESQIRGKHATGLSFIKNCWIETVIEPIGSKEFINSFDLNDLPEVINLIGHCRYSTSDLRYNQPIANKFNSIVHNGVITQKDPSLWKEHFGYDCATKNDSELILKCLEAGKEPLEEFYPSSISVIGLSLDYIYFFRNGSRPLWYVVLDNNYFIASTKDILNRTFDIKVCPVKCSAGIIYELVEERLNVSFPLIKVPDLQKDLPCSDYYSKVVL